MHQCDTHTQKKKNEGQVLTHAALRRSNYDLLLSLMIVHFSIPHK